MCKAKSIFTLYLAEEDVAFLDIAVGQQKQNNFIFEDCYTRLWSVLAVAPSGSLASNRKRVELSSLA